MMLYSTETATRAPPLMTSRPYGKAHNPRGAAVRVYRVSGSGRSGGGSRVGPHISDRIMAENGTEKEIRPVTSAVAIRKAPRVMPFGIERGKSRPAAPQPRGESRWTQGKRRFWDGVALSLSVPCWERRDRPSGQSFYKRKVEWCCAFPV